MGGSELFFLIFLVLGGLVMFIFGMNIMSDGLRVVAGNGLRTLLTKATTNRFAGLALGTSLGFLVHSSAASVMLVGFLNAGLLSLEQAVAPMLGTNLGTALSMQLVSFKLSDYCYVAMVIGLLLQMLCPKPRGKAVGRAIIGFGLLFLGMQTMSDALHPHREFLQQYLSLIDGRHLSGRLLGVAVAWGITAVVQSSGAVIAMSFALADAEAFSSLWQVYPIVIGAQIGTCTTAILGSIGTQIDARRAAIANLGTNLFNGFVGIVLAPLWIPLLETSAHTLRHQIANTHVFLMVQNCCIFLPIIGFYARLIRKIVPSKTAPPAPSYLHSDLIAYPEKAIVACVNELHRIAGLCQQSLLLAGRTLLFAQTPQDIQTIRLNEQAVNDVKLAMKDYIKQLTRRYLSQRQAILLQLLDHCMIDLERIGDHIESICDRSLTRRKSPAAIVGADLFDNLFTLYEQVFKTFKMVAASFTPETDFAAAGRRIELACEDYTQASLRTRSAFNEQIKAHALAPLAGIYFSEYISMLDRIIRHSANIARIEQQPQFWIKQKKIDKEAVLQPPPQKPVLVDSSDYLQRLMAEADTP